MDYYELLQIDATATFDDIHKAYRSLALAYHPDRNSAPDHRAPEVGGREAREAHVDPDGDRSRSEEEHEAERLRVHACRIGRLGGKL